MATIRRWTNDDSKKLVQLHAEGKNLGQCAKILDRSRSTISTRARDLGLTWERKGVEAALQARTIDAKARRAQLKLQLLEDAERLRAQIWQPHTYIDHGGKDYDRVEWTQDEPSPQDKLKLMQSAVIAVDRSLKLDLHDADNGISEAVGMLDSIAKAIQAAASKAPSK